MAHDVFISYAFEDLPLVEAVCAELERGGVRCWYAPRDVPFGTDYEEAIVDAIGECRLVLLLLSSHSNKSAHVRREIQNAHAGEVPRPVLPVRIENVELSKALRYYLGSVQWLDASAPPFDSHLQRLVTHLQARLSRRAADNATPREQPTTPPVQAPEGRPVEPRFNLGLAGMFSSGVPGAPAEGRARHEPESAAEPTAPRAQRPGFFYRLARSLPALRPSRTSPALKWTLMVVAASMLVLVVGFVAISARLSGPVPGSDLSLFAVGALGFLLLEGVLTYVHARRFRRGRLMAVAFFAAAAGVLLAYWNAYYVRAFISGHVQSQAGRSVQGAGVTLSDGYGNAVQTARTDAAGVYRFEGVKPDDYALSVAPPPDYAEYKTIVFADSRYQYVVVTLDSAGPGGLESQEQPTRQNPRRR